MILAGGLGGTVHAIRSLYWYIGNRELKFSWIPMYIMLPVNGATIAVIFHLIILGGFVKNVDQNWSALVGVAALVGLFSQQAALKMKDVANALFTRPGAGEDNKPQGSGAPPPNSNSSPKVTSIEPDEGLLKGGDVVVITGDHFVEGAKLSFGGNMATDVKVTGSNRISAKTPAGKQAGKVVVEVINPDGKSGVLADGYTYQSEDDPGGAGSGT